MPGAARDRAELMHRRRDRLVVEDDGEALADVLRRGVAEAAGADAVEAEIDHRLAGLLVEALLRGDQHLAGHHATRRSERRSGAGLLVEHGDQIGRHLAGGDLLGGTVSLTIWKVSLAVWPITFFSRSGSLSPGAWTTIRSVPWLEDGRLLGAEGWSIRRRTISIDWSTALAAAVAWASGARRQA